MARAVLHEAHHCLRMAGPGYGTTLEEALVSEGLAGRFVVEALGTEPESWERIMPPEEALRHLPGPEALGDAGYDHGEWFFGTGALPRWLGYTLGYAVVGRWMAVTPPEARDWAAVPAAEVLAAARA